MPLYSPVPLSATSVFLLPAWRRGMVPENIPKGKLHSDPVRDGQWCERVSAEKKLKSSEAVSKKSS